MWKRSFLIGSLTALCFLWWSHRSIGREAGVLAPNVPQQSRLAGVKPILFEDYTLIPIAGFDIEARVLGVKRYRHDREAELAPYDLALGWGRMSDSRILDEFKIRQFGRFYYWSTRSCPIPREEIIASSANMHIIPADDAVLHKLQRLRNGHVVKLRGSLVSVRGDDGFIWLSSTTREDSGDGACEVVWVDEIDYY